jgi:hypothetical protein
VKKVVESSGEAPESASRSRSKWVTAPLTDRAASWANFLLPMAKVRQQVHKHPARRIRSGIERCNSRATCPGIGATALNQMTSQRFLDLGAR